MRKKYYLLYILFFILIFGLFNYLKKPDKENDNIVIFQIVEHDALNTTRAGIEDYLKKCCSKFNITYENAQGSILLASQISKKILNSSPKVVIAIGTVAAQSFFKNTQIPVIFSSVTDPISAGLVKDLNATGTNFTGVSNMIDVTPQLKLITDILPHAKKIGIVYNSAESNSMDILKKIKESSKGLKLEIIESVISSSNDVTIATKILINKGVDAIFISNDNTALSAIQGVIKSATQSLIPVFCSDIDTIKCGVLAAFGPDQYKLGLQTGEMVEKILMDGKLTTQMPVEFPKKTELKINMKVANQLKIKINNDILSIASEVYR